MLKEFVHVRQERRAGRRRWFESDGLDLVVWHDAADRIEGFQLHYDFGRGEHALTWRPETGFVHNKVDAGDTRAGGYKLSPILLPDGRVPWAEVSARFNAGSSALEPALRELIRARLAARR